MHVTMCAISHDVLVCVCVCRVNMLFTGLFRLWVQTVEGRHAVQQMDNALVQLFDPNGYLQVYLLPPGCVFVY